MTPPVHTIVWANLDAEATWAGVTLPRAVRRRISLLGTLAASLVDGGDVELWTPEPVAPDRLTAGSRSGVAPVRWAVGTPPRWDVAWAEPTARAFNDRRFAHGLARGLPGTTIATTLADLEGLQGPWIAKAVLTAAGRDRYRGDGPLVDPEGRTRCRRLLETHGALIVEPWCTRVRDVGVCAEVDVTGRVRVLPMHGLLVDARGGFLGIDLAPAPLRGEHAAVLDETVALVGAALARAGYVGPFSVDAFEHVGGFHALCELNARYSFGRLARALARRTGLRVLGFGAPPADATLLIAPAPDDPTCAWWSP